jgi:hypothetical protein
MFVPTEEDFLAAVKNLEDSGFHRAPWSYGTVGPELLGTDPLTLEIHKREIRKYERLDQHSVRFHFPSSFNTEEKVVLLQRRYVHSSPPSAAQISFAPHLPTQQFFVSGNLYFPNKGCALGELHPRDPRGGGGREGNRPLVAASVCLGHLIHLWHA